MAVSTLVSGIFVWRNSVLFGLCLRGSFTMLMRRRTAEQNAAWMSQLLAAMPSMVGVNIRVVHYFAVMRKVVRPGGKVYGNSVGDWEFLNEAYEQACEFGVVPYGLLCECEAVSRILTCGKHNAGRLNKAEVDKRDVHVEVWVESSRSGSVILPAAKKYGVNFIATQGEFSIGDIFEFVRRAASTNVPIRILHLSDYDGTRQDEKTCAKVRSLLARYKMKKDVRIEHLMLNGKQCKCLALPVELGGEKIEINAMEACCPGLVMEMVECNLRKYTK